MAKEGDGDKAIKILLVDDIAEARESIKKLLAFESDFKVVGGAGNGRDGVAQAKELQPDIVIMDINMPDMDGLEAANRITKALPMVGVIMMSVQDDPDYMQKAMMAGARAFISKPPTMDQLYSTIRNVYNTYEPIRRQMQMMLENQGRFAEIEEDDGEGGNRSGHLIVVFSPQGGVGCTTIATSLASGLMQEGVKSLLMDGKLEFGDVGAFLDIRHANNMVDLIEHVNDIDPDYVESIVATHNSGLKVLTGPAKPSEGLDVRNSRPEVVADVVSSIRGYYDFVVVDTASALDVVTMSLLDMADKIVLVLTPTLTCIKNTRLILDLFDQSNFPPEKTALVLNRAVENPTRNQRVYLTAERIQGYLRRPIEGVIPLVEETFILNAVNKGLPVIAADRDTTKPPIKQLMQLSEHLHSMLTGEASDDDIENEKEKRKPKDKDTRTWSLFGR